MPFIFQNSSYVLAYRLSDDEFQQIGEYFTSKSVRSINCQSVEEMNDCLHKIRFLTAVFASSDAKNDIPDLVDSLTERNFSNELIVSVGSNPIDLAKHIDLNTISSKQLLEQILVAMVPPRLDELMLNAMQTLLPSYVAEADLQFSASATPIAFEDYDIMTVCHVAAEPFVGQGTEFANLQKLVEFLPSLKGKSETQLRDYAREMLNQFLGILNRHLLKLDLVTSIGVPEQHDKERVSSIRRTGPYLPTIQMQDQHGIFLFQLGFVHRDGKENLDLSSLELVNSNDDDIDFF